MKSIDLLEKHRRKMAFILGGFITLIIYTGVFLFEYGIMISEGGNLQHLYSRLWIFLALAPIIYLGLSILGCKAMHKVYRPIRESISNLEQFTVNVNHEFKTSLSEIISSLELAKELPDQKQYNTQALSSAKRLNIILDSLTPLVKFTNADYRKEKIDIVPLFEACIQEFHDDIEKKELSIHTSYSRKKIFKHIDSGPLIICFQNILQNAIKYSKDGGNIYVYVSSNSLEVKDEGIGIENENIDKIFERNFQETKDSKGIGVGLSLVKHICEMYEWQLEVKSQKNAYSKLKMNF